jgi:isopenicillin N synthase-like dioxygenase
MPLLSVPVIDIGPYFDGGDAGKREVARQVNRACEEIGFLVITGHRVDPELCHRMFETSRRFFDLPLAEKLTIEQRINDAPRGFSPVAGEGVAYSLLKRAPGDLKESLSIGQIDVPDDEYHRNPAAGGSFAPNRWPEHPPELKELYCEYFGVMERLAMDLMRIFAIALELPEHYFDDKVDRHISGFRVINYPDQAEPPLPGQLRAGEHSDYGTLTILRHDYPHRAGGLQVVTRADEWVDVPAVTDSLVVNLGDMMQRWTNDRWVSTMHRVANPPREQALTSRRMSLVFFLAPNYDATIECLPNCSDAAHPPRHPPLTCGDYIRMKISRQVNFEAEEAAP